MSSKAGNAVPLFMAFSLSPPASAAAAQAARPLLALHRPQAAIHRNDIAVQTMETAAKPKRTSANSMTVES